MQAEIGEIQETYRHMEEVIHDLVECFAIPHTRMCMRWSDPTRGEYRAEVIAWLEDYALSFRRLPQVACPGGPPLQDFARECLDREIRPILEGRNPAVEASFDHLFL